VKILTETKKQMNIPIRKIKKKTPARKWSKFEDLCELFIEDLLTSPNNYTKFELKKDPLYIFTFKYNRYFYSIKNDNPITRPKAMYCIKDCIPNDQVIDLITVMYECGKKYYHMENYKYEYTELLIKGLYKRYGIRSIYLQKTDLKDYRCNIFINYDYDELNAVWGKKENNT
jgi:hypothetical protein